MEKSVCLIYFIFWFWDDTTYSSDGVISPSQFFFLLSSFFLSFLLSLYICVLMYLCGLVFLFYSFFAHHSYINLELVN